MRNKLGILVLALSTALIALAATQSTDTKSTSAKTKTKIKTKPKGATVKPKGSDTSVTKKATAAKVTSKKATPKKTPPKQTATSSRYRRSAQKQPSPDRYQEIQQALADKGYFKGNVDGTWGPESVEALKSFQRNQNIGDDGKIGSMSLIALGLGPKRDGQSSGPPQTAPESPVQ